MKNMITLFIVAFFFAISAGVETVRAETGVLIMHGKGGKNGSRAPTKILAEFLEENGFIVAAPDMPWQRDRLFDKTLPETMTEIDEIVKDLKSRGATKIVIAGHSLGANAAIAYGTRREGLAGILAIAPGHVPAIWRNRFSEDVAKAKVMVDAGKGDEEAEFNDRNQGKMRTFTMAAKYYLSWYDPDGDAVMQKNVPNIKPGTPLMWIIGERDRMADRGEEWAYSKAPKHAKNRYEVVGGGHRATPKIGRNEILEWLKGL